MGTLHQREDLEAQSPNAKALDPMGWGLGGTTALYEVTEVKAGQWEGHSVEGEEEVVTTDGDRGGKHSSWKRDRPVTQPPGVTEAVLCFQ